LILAKETEMRTVVKRLRPMLAVAVGFSVAITFLALAPLGYMRDVYGPVIDARSERTLFWVTVVLLLALVMSALVEWARAKVMAAMSIRFAELVSPRLFEATFRADLQKLQGSRQALSDLRMVRNFITSPSMVALIDAPLGLIFLALVFAIHHMMGFMSVLGAVMVFVIGWAVERKVRPLVQQAQRNSVVAQNFAAESARNAQVVEAMGMRPAIQRRWYAWQNQFLRDQAFASAVQAQGAVISKVVMLAQGSLVLGLGVLLTITGVLPPAAGAALIIAKLLGARAVAPLMQVIQSWKTIIEARDAYERVETFLEKIPPRTRGMPMPPPTGHIAAEAASARAPGTKKTVLTDVSFVVKAGRGLAIVGPSGSGKSSLGRLLVGLWAPIAGTVRLDGVDVSSWDKTELGPHIGYLPQDVELFDGTIAENIARFGEIDEDKVREVCELVGLEPTLAQLSEGIHTPIGDDGCVLSGGQRQRVGLARAMYGTPRLLVLDEPNSSLDDRGEEELVAALAQMKRRGCTVVVITHRKPLLAVVEQILVISEGRAKMFGPKAQVLERLAGKAEPPPATPLAVEPASEPV